jgi:hypothetical protein
MRHYNSNDIPKRTPHKLKHWKKGEGRRDIANRMIVIGIKCNFYSKGTFVSSKNVYSGKYFDIYINLIVLNFKLQ